MSPPPRCWRAATRSVDRALGRPSWACAVRYRGLRIGLIAVALGATTFAAASVTWRRSSGWARGLPHRLLLLPRARDGGRDPARARAGLTPAYGGDRAGREGSRAARRRAAGWVRQRGGRPARVRDPRCLYTAYVLVSAALRDRSSRLRFRRSSTGAPPAFAVAHGVQGGAPVHTPWRRSPSSPSRSCRRPSPSRPSSPGSVASGLPAPASPRPWSRPSQWPAGCHPGRTTAARAVPGRRPRRRGRARDRAARGAAPPCPELRHPRFPAYPRLESSRARASSGWDRRASGERGGTGRPCARARSTRAVAGSALKTSSTRAGSTIQSSRSSSPSSCPEPHPA